MIRPRSLVCPYCYGAFRGRSLLFRCSGRVGSNGDRCQPEPDKVLVDQIGDRTPVLPAFNADMPRGTARHRTCGAETTTRACPVCHCKLPTRFADGGHRMVALIGAKESGKTVYMTVLVHELMHRVGSRFDAAVIGLDDDTRRAFHESEQRLYRDRHLFETTRTVAHRLPLVFRFTTEAARLIGAPVPRHNVFSFFDTAGEDLRSQESIERNVRYLSNADGIIMLLDPLQLAGARATAISRARMPAAETSVDHPVAVLSRVTELLRETLPRRNKRITTPIAVTFSKLDALWHTFPDGTPLRRPMPEAPRYDESDSLDVHEFIRALLHQWQGQQIDQTLRHNYDQFRYFGVSSLGEVPTADHRVSERGVLPYRVADPFLWLLSRFGTIPTAKA